MGIAPNARARKGGKERGEVKRECGIISVEEERSVDYRGMVQPSEQHFAPCVKVVELGLGTSGLKILAAFWAGIPVEVTQEAGVVPRL